MEQPHAFQINFNSLYTALCEQQRSDQATLLLYTLLHQNANMRTYMLSRTDMDNLVGVISSCTENADKLIIPVAVWHFVCGLSRQKKPKTLLRMNQSVIG